MEYLGLFCLGVFTGTVAIVGLCKIQNLTDWRQVFVVVMPALLSGAAMVFVDRFRYSPAVGAFPLGLVVSLLWACIDVALDQIKSSDAAAKAVGWAHVAAAIGVVAGAVPLVVVPAVEQILAESAISRETRIKELQESRSRANWGSPSRSTAGITERIAASSALSSAASAAASLPPRSASSASAAASR